MLSVPQTRLLNQQLIEGGFDKPEDVISWFGAMQAQDFNAAKWAIALRCKNATEESIEAAFNKGEILRTHVMRPTWHFVTPSDIRWLQALTAHRVHRFNGYYYRQTGLDKSIFVKSNIVIKKALVGGKQLTRSELNVVLKEANIPTENLGLSYTIMQAELDALICSGPKKGKQFTYMLLDERIGQTGKISTDEALYELTKRYFQSHGPAQAADFSWWSGLTLTDAKKGIEIVGKKLLKEEDNDKVYFFMEPKKIIKKESAFLIPGFDEYFIAYSDRNDVLDKRYVKELNQGGGMVNGAVIVNGRMIGGWRRTFEKKSVVVTIRLFEKIPEDKEKDIHNQTKRFGEFLHLPVVVHIQTAAI